LNNKLEQIIFETKIKLNKNSNSFVLRKVFKPVASVFNYATLEMIDEILVKLPVFYNFKSDLIADLFIGI
jgi:hypothetical protein